MIYLLSPAKTLDFDSELPTLPATKPRFLAHSSELAGIMHFTGGGYAFDRDLSTADTWTFLRRA